MNKNNYILTKTKITSGIQCEKKLWYDFHEPKNTNDNFIFHIGNRFGKVIRDNYGKGLDLSNIKDTKIALRETNKAILSMDTNIIYEAAFLYLDTLIRIDVLIREKDCWQLLEAKSSTKLKDEHIPDIAIQSFIVKSCGINLTKIKLIHINPDFIYKGDENYKNLIKEIDVTEAVCLREEGVLNHINNFRKFGQKNFSCPKVEIGDHCKKPHDCDYQDRCKFLKPKSDKVSYEILPNKPKKLVKYCIENKIKTLEDVPTGKLSDKHRIIQTAHKNNKEWINGELKAELNKYNWPFYFIDFETINQGVPIINDTKPYDQLPFQWSVHKWDAPDDELKLSDSKSFLDFDSQDIELKFIESLLSETGDKGTVFAHNAATEINVLKRLKKKEICKHLTSKIDALISRIEDTLSMVKKNFYHPIMSGSYKIKKIIKCIPTSFSYEEEGSVKDGTEAQLSWFICTDPNTKKKEKPKQIELLEEYCAKDTLALYYLIKYLIEKTIK